MENIIKPALANCPLYNISSIVLYNVHQAPLVPSAGLCYDAGYPSRPAIISFTLIKLLWLNHQSVSCHYRNLQVVPAGIDVEQCLDGEPLTSDSKI